ncbi:MAG TPA: acyl-CoA dehydrogenase, partial [Ktedonobacteraceae bacterium]|nr:acyl-CoA dehydrogenase [Ktedonobacteraceae bacterium]
LEQWGIHHYYIPEESGGKLTSFEEIFLLMRLVARRDLTVAIAHGGTFLGAIATWIAGSEAQKYHLAEIIKTGACVSLGLTEQQHGGDLLANETQASPIPGGYKLSGEKWLIGNATRSNAITVFARTRQSGGPRGFTLLLVEKERLAPTSFTHLPKERTLGIRGTDISGICFNECVIASSAVIGSEGHGLEIILKGLQVTRTLVSGLSLGTADTALRVAMKFALERRVYGHVVFDIPYSRKMLVESFVDLLICECVTLAAVRSLHAAPEQMSIWSAAAKYFVPTTIENAIHRLSIVLGARYYLRSGPGAGIFQKIVRDNAITSLFDGSTVVNLQAIALQLRSLAGYPASQDALLWTRLESIFCLKKPLPRFHAESLGNFNHGQDDILQGLDLALKALQALKTAATPAPEVVDAIIELASEVAKRKQAQDERLVALAHKYGHALNASPEIYELAKHYCILHAASACIHMWLHNHGDLDEFFAAGEWLVVALNHLLKNLHVPERVIPDSFEENVASHLVKLSQKNQLYSILPFQLYKNEI